MSSPSLSGFEYYVLFIDDYSRKTKDEVFKRFQEFKALVENQTGRKIKVLRSDNGGKYTSIDFIDFCAREGIKKELIVSYNLEQNEVVERKNRSIIGVARVMIHDQRLPLFFWAEACNSAVYLHNRSPHRALGNMTPEEAYTGQQPQVGHLRIFGCITFSHVPKARRTKLEPTVEKGIFMVYSETSKAYWLYILASRRVVVRCDVKFKEERAFRRSRELDEREPQSLQQQESSPRVQFHKAQDLRDQEVQEDWEVQACQGLQDLQWLARRLALRTVHRLVHWWVVHMELQTLQVPTWVHQIQLVRFQGLVLQMRMRRSLQGRGSPNGFKTP